ncbi:MAG: HEAT repeat domain-containing protein [Halococcoides sp.]
MPDRDCGCSDGCEPGDDAPHPEVAVDREDIQMGTASEADFVAADTDPVADDETAALIDRLRAEAATDRQRAALALADRTPTPAVIDALSERARTDPDPTVRQFAVEAIGDLAETTPEAVQSALTDADPWVRAEAVVALDHLDRSGHASRIEDALHDDHHAVRRNAMISLWKNRGDDAREEILALVDDDSDRVREWVAELLGRIDHPDTTAALKTLQTDETSVVAKTAAHALGETDTAGGPPAGSTPTGTDPTDGTDRPPEL